MNKIAERHLVLHSVHINQKIRRIAYEIFENNFKEDSIVLAGIAGQGHLLSQLIRRELKAISPLQIKVVEISINKQLPQQSEILIDCDKNELKRMCIVIVDDVLNTGRTITYAMKPFLSIEVKKVEVAVLVNRSHPLFPIQAQYSGFELSTTLNDHVEVILGDEPAVYLH